MGALGTKKSGTSSVRLPQLTASDGFGPTQEVTPSRQGLNVLVAAIRDQSGLVTVCGKKGRKFTAVGIVSGRTGPGEDTLIGRSKVQLSSRAVLCAAAERASATIFQSGK